MYVVYFALHLIMILAQIYVCISMQTCVLILRFIPGFEQMTTQMKINTFKILPFFKILRSMENAKAEKIQDIEKHTKTTVLNQENDVSNPRLLYITARNSIHVQDVVNTCVKWKSTCKNKRLMH